MRKGSNYEEKMAVYIERLEKSNNRLALSIESETRVKMRQIEELDNIDEKVAAFRGYEPKYDRRAIQLEASENILNALKAIFDKATR